MEQSTQGIVPEGRRIAITYPDMTTLTVRHLTRYSYSAPVSFGVHRLMLRPRDGHDMRILDSILSLSPPADVRWEFDTFGNSVAFAAFRDAADELTIDSTLVLRRYVYDEPVGRLAPRAAVFPFTYGEDERIDLGPLLRLQCPRDQPAIAAWLQRALPRLPGHSLEVLQGLSEAVHGALGYRRREEEGVQTPGETLATRSGTCRDFAFLFIEAARHLGFAARFVTGYLHDPAADAGQSASVAGSGSTHAWAEVFVPGAGWVEFDPTNRIVAGSNLIRVAATRTPAQALPVRGSFRGDGRSLGLEVSVTVRQIEPPGKTGIGADAGLGNSQAIETELTAHALARAATVEQR